MIKLTVVGGYLGVGKTTLVNHLLQHNEGLRIGLLINDFGDINIDARLIASADDQQINLANGCVCCTLTDGFFAALETLQAVQPPLDHIVVEASGVADVVQLSQYGHIGDLTLQGIIVIADAETVMAKAQDKYVAQTVLRQLRGADILVVNKADLVDDEQKMHLEAWLSSTCPDVKWLWAQHCIVPIQVLLGEIHNRVQHQLGHEHNPHEGHASYASWSLTLDHVVSADQIHAFANELGDAVLRGKGIFQLTTGQLLEVQKVGRRVEFRMLDGANAGREVSEFVAIGLAQEFDAKKLQQLANGHFGAQQR